MIGNDWDEYLKEEYKKEYFINLLNFVEKEYQEKTIYPYYHNIFKALQLTSYQDVKVVILGQDPYHGVGQAHGLSFSVLDGVAKPPSLKNIFKEMESDIGIKEPKSGNLTKWAEQGVLLLNTVLTVEKDKAASHKDRGWEIFTDRIIELVASKETPVVFILWGSFARSKKKYIYRKNHYVIESAHPSPLSAHNGFFGSKPFSKTNQFLKEHDLKEIDFSLE